MHIIFAKILYFLTVFLVLKFTLYLFPSDIYADIASYAILVGFGSMLIISPQGTALLRSLNELKYSGGISLEMRNLTISSLILCFFILFVICCIDVYADLPAVYFFIPFGIFFSGVVNTYISLFSVMRSVTQAIYFNIGVLVASVSIAGFFYVLFGGSAVLWVVGLLLGQLVFYFFFLFVDEADLSGDRSESSLKDYFKKNRIFWFGLFSTALFGWLLYSLPRLAVGLFIDPSDFGVLLAAFVFVTYMVGGGESIISTYLQTRFFRFINTQNADVVWRDYFRDVLVFSFGVLFCVSWLGPLVADLMFPESYTDSLNIVPIAIAVEFSRMLMGLMITGAHVYKDFKAVYLVQATGLSISISILVLLFYSDSPLQPQDFYIFAHVGAFLAPVFLTFIYLLSDRYALTNELKKRLFIYVSFTLSLVLIAFYCYSVLYLEVSLLMYTSAFLLSLVSLVFVLFKLLPDSWLTIRGIIKFD